MAIILDADLLIRGEKGTRVVIPDSATSIGDYAFSWCTGLTTIAVDESNASYSSLVDG